jgi:sec-independent protein translocase protein TatB
MFDIGFSEIVVIGVVALVVIGPERLPKAARTLGVLFGRMQRYVSEVKADINREMALDDLKRLQQDVKTAAADLQSSVQQAVGDFQSGVRDIGNELDKTAATAQAALADTAASAAPAADSAAAASESAAAAAPAPVTETETETAAYVPLAEPPLAPEPALADPVPSEPPQQSALPGFEKI